MRRVIKKYITIIILLFLTIFVLQKINWLPDFRNIFRSEPVTIDNTDILIKEINNLSQLITITSYNEVVMDSVKQVKRLPGKFSPSIKASIVLIGKGKVIAGIDLKKITENDITITMDSINIELPKAEIIFTILNPSDYETFAESGTWSPDEVTQIKVRIRDRINQLAIEQQLLHKATERGKVIIETFLRSAGFKDHKITFTHQSL